MQREVHPVTAESTISGSPITGVLHPCKGMLHDGTKAGNQTIMPLLLGGQFFLASNTPLDNAAKDAPRFQGLFAVGTHIRTVGKDAVLFLLGQIIEVL